MSLAGLLLTGAVDLKNDTLHARIFRSPALTLVVPGDHVSTIGSYAISDVVDIGTRTWNFMGINGGWRIIPPQTTYNLHNFNAYAASDGLAVAVLYRPSDGLIVSSDTLGIGQKSATSVASTTTAKIFVSAIAQNSDPYYGPNQLGNTWWGERRFLEGWINWTTRTWRVVLLDDSWAATDQTVPKGVQTLSDIPFSAVVAASDPLTGLTTGGAAWADDPTFPSVPPAGRRLLHAALYADTGDVIRIITFGGSGGTPTTDGTNPVRMAWGTTRGTPNPAVYFGL